MHNENISRIAMRQQLLRVMNIKYRRIKTDYVFMNQNAYGISEFAKARVFWPTPFFTRKKEYTEVMKCRTRFLPPPFFFLLPHGYQKEKIRKKNAIN